MLSGPWASPTHADEITRPNTKAAVTQTTTLRLCGVQWIVGHQISTLPQKNTKAGIENMTPKNKLGNSLSIVFAVTPPHAAINPTLIGKSAIVIANRG